MNKYILILAGFFTIGLIACSEKKEEKVEVKKFVLSDTMSKMITIDSVSSCFINDEITLNGEISFNENNVNKVYPRSSGQVVESKVTLGDKVQAGQVLAILKSADVAGNYADLSSANSDIIITKRQLDNTEALYKNGIASEKEYTEAKQNYEKALTAKGKIQSIININGGNGSNAGGTYNLISPISGYIVEKKVNTGNFIRADMGDYLFTISDLKNVWIQANVYESNISKVHLGDEVSITTVSYPEKIFKGKIDKILNVLDPTNKVMKVRIILSNENYLLKPQMFTRVVVINKENKQSLCIPNSALIFDHSENFVLVYKGKGIAEIRHVQIINTINDKTYLSGGVGLGEKVVGSDAILIYDALNN